MDSGFSKHQLEVLRRVRNGEDLRAGPLIRGLAAEVEYLCELRMLQKNGGLDFTLTDLGRVCLGEAERPRKR